MHIIIVGSGPASAFIASQLDSSKQVTIIEQSCYSGQLNNYYDSIMTNLTSNNNIRLAEQIGGGSNYWGGGYLKYDEIDLRNTISSKYRKWPIEIEELDYFYSEAEKICGIKFPNTEQVFQKLRIQTTIVQKTPFCVTGLFEKPNIKINKNMQVVDIIIDPETKNFTSVQCLKKESGEITDIAADICILAAGTINNVRILSKMIDHKKIRGINDLGLNLGTHPKANIGNISINQLEKKVKLIESRHNDSVWKHLSLNEDILIKSDLPNHSIRFEPIISSLLNDYKIKFAQFLFDQNLVSVNSRLFKYLRITFERILNFIFKYNFYERYRVRFYLDQAAKTGVHLEIQKPKEKNALPPYKLCLDILESEKKDMLSFITLFNKYFYEETSININLKEPNTEKFIFSHSHFIGGTVMGTDSSNSAVDPNLHLHNAQNIYVAGSSVFPTHSYCNPFFTIAALSIRLGRHLNGRQ